jgi:SNF2 domain-containing protein/helicase-like protein/SWIM zinc finger
VIVPFCWKPLSGINSQLKTIPGPDQMSLKTKLSSEFQERIKYRGFRYFRDSGVEILEHSDSHLLAKVHGTEPYLVRLAVEQNTLYVTCTCPHFADGEACKHLWATILTVDNGQYLSEALSRPRLYLFFDFQTAEQLEDLAASQTSSGASRSYSDQMRSSLISKTINQPQLRPPPPPKPVEPEWQRQLSLLSNNVRTQLDARADDWNGREIFYLIDPDTTRRNRRLTFEIGYRELTMKGEWGKIKTQRIPLKAIDALTDTPDKQILTILFGAKEGYWGIYDYGYTQHALSNWYSLSAALEQLLMPMMCATGRCFLRSGRTNADLQVINWDAGPPWQLWLTLKQSYSRNAAAAGSNQQHEIPGEYSLSAILRRDSEQRKLSSLILSTEVTVIGQDFRAARIDSQATGAWADAFSKTGELKVPAKDVQELISHLVTLPAPPRLDLPEELRFERVCFPPAPHLIVRRPKYAYSSQSRLEAELFFNYQGKAISFQERSEGFYDRDAHRMIERDWAAESNAAELLKPLGFRITKDYDGNRSLNITTKKLPRAVSTLVGRGWKVEAEGKLYRNPGFSSLWVSSGIDWFELHGSVNFGDGLEAKLPDLLSALRKGESMVALGDGSFGLLPEDWLKKYGLLASLGTVNDDHLRFQKSQTGLLDAMLAAQPEITCDLAFTRVREEWQNFKGIEPVMEPPGFVGRLRGYQREGLGWFKFLEHFGFGGCLADDMGLGKTVQVLALLESRRNGSSQKGFGGKSRKKRGAEFTKSSQTTIQPSLVVVPRSLVFNWQQEAARFTPSLRLLIHTGQERIKDSKHFENYDLVITTYGTLRRDAVHFQDAEFDFVILDESQAIKNAGTESAKATRLLKGKHRLALSGTPIENHLGELWSLFEFLNPGMLGTSSVFQTSIAARRVPNDETLKLLTRALRPFLLRRTKEKVAKELPEKIEQTIYCEMEGSQRKHYDELRNYYRALLLERVERDGINRSKIQILEALLRLRQAACHPALVTGGSDEGPSAKLDVLIPKLHEVVEEEHKALVFSQFTSLLAIVRRRLGREGIEYEYLDGKTRDRGSAVERFQNDPKCKLFLISLKAGGQGLNLTAAEYVFLLDPWWNPAVEAQAIDRAHRIGQTRRVIAYRLIARDTVEEKVLELQATKRELADAIINADNSLIRNITGEDLRLLLS